MKKVFIFLSLFMIAASSFAQTARIQIIHNSPSPTVDIWLNGAKLLTDLKYRTATPFIDAPANVDLKIEIKLPKSVDTTKAVATFNVNLVPTSTYVAIATGIVGNAQTPFTLKVIGVAKEKASDATKTGLVVYHGSPDAPAVDVIARSVATLVEGAAYNDATNYFEVPSAKYILDITPTKNPAIVASFNADLSSLGGGAAVVFASGFLAPKTGEPAFGLFAALPNGTVVALPALTTARLQVIHNSPSPTVDIWLNGTKLLTDFKYRNATPFIDAPANTNLKIEVKLPNSTATTAAVATFNATLIPAKTYVAVATGIVGDTKTPFTLKIIETAKEKSSDAQKTGLVVYHGSTDAPAVDVIARGVATLVVGAAYNDATNYLEVPSAKYILDITPTKNPAIVASFDADLSKLGGGAAVVFASGFLAPKTGEPAFGLFAALPNGTVVTLPALTTARLQVIHNSPSPTVDIWLNGTKLLTDFKYRTATPYIDAPANTNLKIEVKLPNSTATTAAVATFNATLIPAESYQAIATGIVGDAKTPFTLALSSGATEKSSDGKKVAVAVFHGSTDAPEVDVVTGGNVLFDNLKYLDIEGYAEVPAAKYVLNVTPAQDNKTVVAAFTADLTTLSGSSVLVMASGFLAPKTGEPAFGLFAVLPNGTVIALPTSTTSAEEVAKIVSNYDITPSLVTDFTNVNFTLTAQNNISIFVTDISGRVVFNKTMGSLSEGQYTETIEASTLAKGIYNVTLNTPKGIQTKRFVKE